MDDLLYHYTSSNVFASILARPCLWLSGRWNQNDSNEGRVFGRHLRDLASKHSIATDKVEAILSSLESLESYVSCFSANGDLLSQWRGYASNATGVSIGFRREALISLVKGDTMSLLRPVTYADELAELCDETRDLMLALLRSTGTPRQPFLMSAAKVMWEIKNRAFSEEAETRLIFTAPSEPGSLPIQLKSGATVTRKYRAVDTGIREYCEINMDNIMPDAIGEVILGPRSDSHIDVVKRMLAAVNSGALVRCSSATYR
jgi:hypothetical protein